MNAQKELLEHIGTRKVDFVSVAIRQCYSSPKEIKGTLEEVLPLMNFEYDSGYGGQELFGYIWYEDGTWSERGEYDGAEWWQHQQRPNRDDKIST